MDVEFQDLRVFVDQGIIPWKRGPKREILRGVSGVFRASELTAILGPSGAGKTTLLNAVSGYKKCGLSGRLLLNGQPREESKFRKLSCYITQEDLLIPQLTLEELMLFAASLKLPAHFTRKQRRSVVDEIQGLLGLSEARHTFTDCLSGGQRKRTAIALELINNPPIIFLDEPTSGLDNVTASQLIRLLNQLSKGGRTIICTIHQPSASLFEIFDSVYFIGGGRCVYQGAPGHHVLNFLSEQKLPCPQYYNPADYIIELMEEEKNIEILSEASENGTTTWVSKDVVLSDSSQKVYGTRRKGRSRTRWPRCGKNSKSGIGRMLHQIVTNGDSFSRRPRLTSSCSTVFMAGLGKKLNPSTVQIDCHFGFSFLLCFNVWYFNKKEISLHIALSFQQRHISKNMILQVALNIQFFHHLGCALAVGIVFYNKGKDGQEFFGVLKLAVGIILFHTYTQCMTPILTYPFQVKLLKKEHFNQWYKLFPYYLAHSAAYAPPLVFFSLIFIVTVYFLSGLPLEPLRFFVVAIVGIMTALVAEGLGLTISSIFSVTNGSVIGPLTVAPILGFATYGFDFARTVSPFMKAVVRTSFMRAGVTALTLAIFGMDRGKLACDEPIYCHFSDPKVTLYYLNLENDSVWDYVLNLFFLLCIFRLAFYYGLKWRLRI